MDKRSNGTPTNDQDFLIFTVRIIEDLPGPEGVTRVKKGQENKMKMSKRTDLGAAFKQFCTMHSLDRKTLSFTFSGKEVDENTTPEKLGLRDADVISVTSKSSSHSISSPVPPSSTTPTSNSQINPNAGLPSSSISSTFTSDFKKLLTDGLFSDVTIVAKGEKEERIFQCHRSILAARCTKFHNLFSDLDADQRIEVKHEPNTYAQMLEYLYTDTFQVLDYSSSQELLAIADEYMLPRLKVLCEKQLMPMINVDNVAAILAHAYQYNAMELKKQCCRVILENQSMLHNPEFQKTIRIPELLYELLQLFAKQIEAESSNPSTPPSKKRKT